LKKIIRIIIKFGSELVTEFKSILWRLSSSSSVKLKLIEGQVFKFVRYGDITKMLYVNQHLVNRKKSFEYDSLELFKSYIKEGDVVFDIGANVGIYTMIAAKSIGTKGNIYAFEPAKATFQALKKNVNLNKLDNVKINELALSDSNGFIEMVSSDIFDETVFYDAFLHIKKSDKGNIKSVRLDDFVAENKITKLDFIKIDVEGAELLCFKGGIESLSKFKPILLFEAFEDYCNRYDYTITELLIFLDSLGYVIKQLNEYQWIATHTKNNDEH